MRCDSFFLFFGGRGIIQSFRELMKSGTFLRICHSMHQAKTWAVQEGNFFCCPCRQNNGNLLVAFLGRDQRLNTRRENSVDKSSGKKMFRELGLSFAMDWNTENFSPGFVVHFYIVTKLSFMSKQISNTEGSFPKFVKSCLRQRAKKRTSNVGHKWKKSVVVFRRWVFFI